MSDVVDSGAPPFNLAVDICRHHVWCREKWHTTFQFSCRHMSTSCLISWKVVHHLSIHLSKHMSTSCLMSWKVVHHLSIHLSTYVDIMSDVVDSGAPPFNSLVDICRHHVWCREKWCNSPVDICRHHVCCREKGFNSPVDICRHHVRCREKWCTTFQFTCRHMSTYVRCRGVAPE